MKIVFGSLLFFRCFNTRLFVLLALFTLVLGCSSDSSDDDSANSITTGSSLQNGELILAVDGRGYLIMSDQGAVAYRRNGIFSIDADKFLVSEQGERLQGFMANSAGVIISGVLADLALDGVDLSSVEIDSSGLISSTTNNIKTIHSQIVFADFVSPFQLSDMGSGLYGKTLLSGQPIIAVPETGSLGALSVGSNDVPEADYLLSLRVTDGSYLVLDHGAGLGYTSEVELFSDNQGFLIDSFASQLVGYLASNTGVINTSTLQSLQLRDRDLAPKSTDTVSLVAVLNSLDSVKTAPFSASDAETYNTNHNVVVFDSLGNEHRLTLYFVLMSTSNEWDVYYQFVASDSSSSNGGLYRLEFDSSGDLITSPSVLQTGTLAVPTGASSLLIDIDVSAISQLPQSYSINSSQNGYATGRLKGTSIDECGKLITSYSNDVDVLVGQVALARFANVSGLTTNGVDLLVETASSGVPAYGVPCEGSLSAIQGDEMD